MARPLETECDGFDDDVSAREAARRKETVSGFSDSDSELPNEKREVATEVCNGCYTRGRDGLKPLVDGFCNHCRKSFSAATPRFYVGQAAARVH